MALSYWPSEKYSTPCALLDAAVAPEETHPAEHKSAARQHAAAAIEARRVSQALNEPSKGVWLFDDFWINIIPLTHDEPTRLLAERTRSLWFYPNRQAVGKIQFRLNFLRAIAALNKTRRLTISIFFRRRKRNLTVGQYIERIMLRAGPFFLRNAFFCVLQALK